MSTSTGCNQWTADRQRRLNMNEAMNPELNPRNGKTKVDLYKWLMTGKPGELLYLAKTALEVDHAYQRTAKNARVVKLAKRWNWLACGTLTVANRGGRYYVVDGQHRLMAALKRSDVERLPCLVFESSDMLYEAVAFRDANKERRPITTFEQWKSDRVAQDEPTLFAHKIITNAGRIPSQTAGPTTVRCLTSVVAAARNAREELNRVWPLAVQVCQGNALHERVFGALMYLECNLAEGQSVANKHWRDKILRLGYKGILDSTNRAAVFYAKGGPKVWALGVIQELNKGSRTQTLASRGEVAA